MHAELLLKVNIMGVTVFEPVTLLLRITLVHLQMTLTPAETPFELEALRPAAAIRSNKSITPHLKATRT